jgi:hypothetical protein
MEYPMTKPLAKLTDAEITGMFECADIVEAALAAGPAFKPIVAADRCELCGARAVVRLTLPTGEEWLYCLHDFRAVDSAKLRANGAVIYTDQAALAAQLQRPET